MKSSFQGGVDTLYNKCVSCGSTPSNKTPTAIATSIGNIYTNRYNSGVSNTKKGNATVDKVLSGYTFTSTNGVNLTGTMANKGAWTSTPTASGKVTIPAGYHNGNGYVDTSSVYNAGLSNGSISSYEKITLTNNVIPNDCKVLLVETLAYSAYGGYNPGAASCTVSGNGTVYTLRNQCPSSSPVNSMLRAASFLVLNAQGQTITVKSGSKTNVAGTIHYFKLS